MLDALSIAVRWALYLDLGLLFGVPLFTMYSGEKGPAGGRSFPVILGVGGLALSVTGFLVMIASMAGSYVFPVDGEIAAMLLADTGVGWAFIARSAALLLILAAALTMDPAGGGWRPVVLPSAAVAVASLAWNGHGAASEGAWGWIHLASDVTHLLAASAWLGALWMFIRLIAAGRGGCRRTLAVAQRALAAFAVSGSVIVGLILASGMINAAMLIRLEDVPALGSTVYGRLLIVKFALFLGMLGLAASNRFRLTPALQSGMAGSDGPHALAPLRRSLALEAALAVAILGLVAWLGTLPPPGAA
jgi:copper resistance protein D